MVPELWRNVGHLLAVELFTRLMQFGNFSLRPPTRGQNPRSLNARISTYQGILFERDWKTHERRKDGHAP